ncbi:Uncharacterised protein [Raoultella ornithinolytica]|nr:Uncharacterised protein [Raoultella ornithinolytica]
MSLSGPVIRILPKNNHFDIAKFGITKGIEDIFLRRINRHTRLALFGDSFEGIHKIGLLLLFRQHVVPGQRGGHLALLQSVIAIA